LAISGIGSGSTNGARELALICLGDGFGWWRMRGMKMAAVKMPHCSRKVRRVKATS
jgi:hypothetical protein